MRKSVLELAAHPSAQMTDSDKFTLAKRLQDSLECICIKDASKNHQDQDSNLANTPMLSIAPGSLKLISTNLASSSFYESNKLKIKKKKLRERRNNSNNKGSSDIKLLGL